MNSQQHEGESVIINISTPGKIILFGEHSVVYGKLAIAASLDLRTKLCLTATTPNAIIDQETGLNNRLSLDFSTLNYKQSFEMSTVIENLLQLKQLSQIVQSNAFDLTTPHLLNHQQLIDLVNNFVRTYNPTYSKQTDQQLQAELAFFYLFTGIFILGAASTTKSSNIDIKISTDLIIGAGTGSSASYLVSIAAALIRFVSNNQLSSSGNNIKIDKGDFNANELKLISQWAYCAEKIIHGTPSGIDNTICTFGNLLEFRRIATINDCKKQPITEITKINRKLQILLINSRTDRETKVLVAKVAKLRANHQIVIDQILDAMDQVAISALDYVKKIAVTLNSNHHNDDHDNYYIRLGQLIDINHNLLRSLTVSHRKLDEICTILNENGLNGKLTGAGGGGYAISLIPPFLPPELIQTVIKCLNQANFDAILVDLGGDGVRIES